MSETIKYNVLVSGRARSMLFEHASFLAQVSMNAAEELFDQFEEKVITLGAWDKSISPKMPNSKAG